MDPAHVLLGVGLDLCRTGLCNTQTAAPAFMAVHTELDGVFLGQRTALALAFEKCSLSRLDELGDALLAKP